MLDVLLLFAMASAQQSPLEDKLADPMALDCSWSDESEYANKAMTALVIGYVNGFAEAANAKVSRTSFDQPKVARRIADLCARTPTKSLREIARMVLKEAGIEAPRRSESR